MEIFRCSKVFDIDDSDDDNKENEGVEKYKIAHVDGQWTRNGRTFQESLWAERAIFKANINSQFDLSERNKLVVTSSKCLDAA
jgi:hypothetical protein